MIGDKQIELLAPAKNVTVGKAAIDAGADAVYIGGPAFGARKAAGNSIEDIAELVRYASFWDARVLVTLNTLLREDEYGEAVSIAYQCREAGVYALIVQDMRLAQTLLQAGFRLHASTQCDNRTAEKVQALEQLGFSRVVLARELSYQQMAEIRAVTTCELEAFVHGALCVCYSGMCYLSEAVCGRSANRGECAQMCRLPYDILDKDKKVIAKEQHILSLYDLDRSAHLRELLDTGVTTLKIEGRLKDIDYVKNITAYYNLLLNDIGVSRTSRGRVILNFTPDPVKTFHRGSTEYFSLERPHNLVNRQTPKSTGELIGYAPLPQGLLRGKTMHNGDGLTFNGQGCYWSAAANVSERSSAVANVSERSSAVANVSERSDLLVENVSERSQTFTTSNGMGKIKEGTPVYRNFDAEFNRTLMQNNAAVRLLPVSIIFSATNAGFDITIRTAHSRVVNVWGVDGSSAKWDVDGSSATSHFEASHEAAENAERAETIVRQQLAKLGGTPLIADEIIIQWQTPYFLRTSVLNDWRRKAVEKFITEYQVSKCHPQSRSETQQTPSSVESTSERGRDGVFHRLSTVENVSERSETFSTIERSQTFTTLHSHPSPLMTCKYCILYEMNCCKKKKTTSKQKTPAYIRHADTLLRIETDCQRCEMTLVENV